MRKSKINKKKFKELFYKKRLSNKEIAKYFGVSPITISDYRWRHKLPVRGFANPPWLGKKLPKYMVEQIRQRMKIQSAKEKNPNWKGGRYITKWGYVYIRVENNHPTAYRGYRKEHRYVMEKHLGRLLKSSEHIHHINGNKTDNRIKNLILISNSKHLKTHYPKGSKLGINIKK